jgi:undecaprenyl-diphosphatase
VNGLGLLIASFLGILQGLTEFLPVSSDGHLVIAQGYLAVLNGKTMAYIVVLHLGTLLAVVFYYRRNVGSFLQFLLGKEVRDSEFPVRRWFWLIVIATIPSGVIGLSLDKTAELLFASPGFAAGAIMANGILLLTTAIAQQGRRQAGDLGVGDALLIGFVQGFSILPGISRSSNTIAAAMFLGVKRDVAARFSFLISIPAITGAVIVKLNGLQGTPLAELTPLAVGAAIALATGLCAIAFLLRVIKRGKFQYFGIYCLIFGGSILFLRNLVG